VRVLGAMPASAARRWVSASALPVFLVAALRSGLTVAGEAGHVPPESGLFARRFANSPAVHSALALADGGRCTLAAPHAFWLYPQIGTRPISWWTDAYEQSARGSQPRCVLLLRERVEYNTDRELFAARLRAMSRASHARLLQRDALAELWLTAAR
jgi:hypothetical protein